jgi:hypothetical protein
MRQANGALLCYRTGGFDSELNLVVYAHHVMFFVQGCAQSLNLSKLRSFQCYSNISSNPLATLVIFWVSIPVMPFMFFSFSFNAHSNYLLISGNVFR